MALLAIGYGVWRAWPRPIEQEYSQPRTKIRIVEGDLFAQDCNIVVGMTTSFDTAVPHIIQSDGVQGQLLSKVSTS